MKNIDDLIIRFLTGVTSKDESRTLIHWIKNSAVNREYFNTFRNIWLASSQIQVDKQFSVNRSNPDQSDSSNYRIKTGRSHSFFRELAKIAAIFMFALVIGALGYRTFYGKADLTLKKLNPVTIECKRGAMSSVILQDGSKAWLNAESKITYRNNYNNSLREIELIGEAYFEVVTNPAKPFVVKAGNLAIKALGTSFNVKAYPEDRSVITTLVKGRVVIEGKDRQNRDFEIDLKPNQTITYFVDQQDYIANLVENTEINPEAQETESLRQTELENFSMIKLEQVKTELFTSWKDKNWVIEQQSLGNLSRELERRYGIVIEFTSENIKKYRFSGTIQNETIEQILYILHKTLPLKYTIEKGRVVIDEDRTLMKEFNRQ